MDGVPQFDQRGTGFDRVIDILGSGARIDMGAFELQAPKDLGDAPDPAIGTATGDYKTRAADDGPRHIIVEGIQLGAAIDADNDGQPTAMADGDDMDGSDDEDGLSNPAVDLLLIEGVAPTVHVDVTNTTGNQASLFGWIDYDNNGIFDNTTERAAVAVPAGSNGIAVTLNFPAVPAASAGNTFARFRLSTDVAAANPTGPAVGGEVEDYPVIIEVVPEVQSVVVDDGTGQRSMVRSLTVTFDTVVTFDQGAFSVIDDSNNQIAFVDPGQGQEINGKTVVTLTFDRAWVSRRIACRRQLHTDHRQRQDSRRWPDDGSGSCRCILPLFWRQGWRSRRGLF